MIKRSLLCLMVLPLALMLFATSARAGSITEEEAAAKAALFLQTKQSQSGGKRHAAGHLPPLVSVPTGEQSLYVFNIGDDGGFVIVSGDDRTRPILGYTDSGMFSAGNVPVALREMLAVYARQISMLGTQEAKANSTVARAMSRQQRISGTLADVAPLLTTAWDQFSPYNDYCPLQGDNQALTGCVATAMAQIANYHKYPMAQVPSLEPYVSQTNAINVSAWSATTFDWDNMLNSYDATATDAQKRAVATLMRYCGQAAQMDYGFDRSGTYNGNAYVAFTEKLGYSSEAKFVGAANYTADGWEDLIYKEVYEGRPVYYSALNGDEGGAKCGGHAFVIDGYQADGNFFHVNWGWGGACNGYFNLFALDPDAPESPVTATGWHYQMLAIVGLAPEAVNTAKLVKDASGSWLITSTADWNELADNLAAYSGGSFKLTSDISVTTMVGTESMPFSGTFDGQGHTLSVDYRIETFDSGHGQAPFSKIAGALIKNVHTKGTIILGEGINDDINAAGIVGYARGESSTIQNCWSSVIIDAQNASGNHGIAGIIGSMEADVFIKDCLFDGSISGQNSFWNGGFVGYVRGGNVTILNSLQAGTFSTNSDHCGSFVGTEGGGKYFENCYYINSYGENQGTAVTAEQLADGTITQKLQSGQRDWTTSLVWGQQLGTDATPLLTSDPGKGIYKVSFTVDGQVVKNIFTNSPIGAKMPAGEEFGLTGASFTYNGSPFTSTTAFSSDITINVAGTSAYTLTLNKPANGSISVNNNSCIPGTLKKVTAIPAAGYVVSAVTAKDASGKVLPITKVSNSANEFVFAFPLSSVTVTAEFIAGETEPTRFINGGMMLPSSWRSGNQPWTADTWMIWGDAYNGTDNVIVGTPPADALGHQWYEEGYALTNSDTDVLPNGNKIVWENHAASFRDGGNYDYFAATGASGDRTGDFYIRRLFTFNTETVPSKLYLSCSYDDSPVEYYINGTLVYEDHRTQSWHDDSYEVELTPDQIALIHTDGTPNVLAVHTSQNWGGYHLDCGLYDPTVISYEVTGEQTVSMQPNKFLTGDVVIPETVTYNGKTYTVTELPDDATNDLPYVTSMSLPRSITGLGTRVFANLPNLRYVKSYIPIYQVYDQKVLVAAPLEATEFEVDVDCSRICDNAFLFTDKLTTLTLPRSLTSIGNNAFAGCSALTEVYSYARLVPQTEGNAFEGIDKSKVKAHVYQSVLNDYKESWGEEFQYVTMPDPQPVSLTVDVANAGTIESVIGTAAAEKGSTVYDVVGISVTGTLNQADLRVLSAMCSGIYSLATIDLSGATIDGNYIGNEMFRNREKLTSIALPSSMKRIRSYAFDNCPNLVSVTGLEGLDDAEAWQDWYAFGLEPNIEGDVYGGTTFLSLDKDATGEYQVPAGIKVIVGGAMHGRNITSIVIPASVTDLGNDVFRGCHQLTDFYVYSTTPPVCHDGSMEYDYDKSQATLHVPASAVEDYKNAGEWREFGRIVGIATGELVDMTINVATAGTLNDALFDAAVASAQISDKTLIRNLTVTGNINADDVAYLNTLPNTLYNIEQLDLSATTLAGNAIGERMFYATLYKAVKLPTAVTSIAAEAFRDSRRLREVTLPESLQTIGSHAFASTGLTSITIPDGVTEMGDRGVQSCAALTSITLGNGLTNVPECWAEFCDNLGEVTIGKRVTSIGWRAFRGSNIKHVYSYARNAPSWNDSFYDGIHAEAVLHVYSNSVKRYQNANGWQNFTTIVGDLGTYPTFELAVNVQSMGTFSSSLQTAMTAAGCEDMTDITRLTVTGSMNDDDLGYLRDNVGRTLDRLDLSAVTLENNNLYHQALAGCAFEEVLLPTSLEYIQGWYVLEGCSNLKTIDIPSKVRYICPAMLNGATSLETVTGGNGVNEMDGGNGMYFDNCPNLQSAVILNNYFYRLPSTTTGTYEVPDHVTTIARDAMWNVSGLSALTLPESVTTIYGNAFSNDNNLKDIYYYAVELPYTDGETFGGFNRAGCTLHVYEEMVEVFQSNERWSEFNIVGDLGAMPSYTPINEADYAALCDIYNALNGDQWTNRWITNKNVQTASRWSGVTFDDEGYVKTINLSERGLSGDVSSMSFSGLTRLTDIDLSNNALTGDIQSLAASLPSGCTLNVERQDLGYVGELTLYEASNYTGLPSIAYWRSDAKALASTLVGVGGHCQFYHPGTEGGQYWDCYIHADGRTDSYNKFYWPSPATMECVYPHRFTFTYTYEMGDANMDDALNVLDLQSTLNYSNNQSSGLFNFCAADTYGPDDDINVQDIVTTVSILLAQPGNDSHGGARQLRAAAKAEPEACVRMENGQIVLYTTRPVAAIDLQLAGITPSAICWQTDAMGFATTTRTVDGSTRAIVYSLTPRELSEGRTVLATFDTAHSPHLAAAVLSDRHALPVTVGTTLPTAISATSQWQGQQQAEYYDLQGRKVSFPARKGMYIDNGKKVVIK